MVSSIFDILRRGVSPPPRKTKLVEKQSAVRAIPASWYTSQEMYELEKRAIFTRRWLLITHGHRLKQVGDWLHYDVVNINFVLYRAGDGNIHGVRNASTYHEISADHFPIHIHIDYNGFIWVNLDDNEVPEISWDELFEGIDRQDRYEGLNFDDYEFDHSWQMDGPYNWKIASDNYNECYHCATTHPDLKALTNLESYRVETNAGWIKHFVGTKPEEEAQGRRVHPTYFYPSSSMNVSCNFFMLQRFIPHGPTKSTMYYEVYRNKNASDSDFTVINEIYKRVMSEDKILCQLSQQNVNNGVFVNGEMHPRLEKGSLFIQRLSRADVVEYHKRQCQQQRQKQTQSAVGGGSWIGLAPWGLVGLSLCALGVRYAT